MSIFAQDHPLWLRWSSALRWRAAQPCAQTATRRRPMRRPPTVADAARGQAKVLPNRRKKIAASVVVLVTNLRAVALTELDAAPRAARQAKPIVANLAPGKKTSVRVAHGKSCVFDLHGAYADGSSTDLASVDLCKDKNDQSRRMTRRGERIGKRKRPRRR